jgi:methylmalonyl-CoA mutase C-terminal domain/subunit
MDAGRDDVLLIGGGIIPQDDIERLEREGVAKVFKPGTSTQEIVEYIRSWAASRPA